MTTAPSSSDAGSDAGSDGSTDSKKPELSVSDLRYPSVLYACGLGSGLMPKAPGTWGSVLGVALWYAGIGYLPHLAIAALLVAVFALGLVAIADMQKRFGVMDAPEIVIDEIVGVWIALWLAPFTWWGALLAFAAFRLFDIWKPWPVSWADRLHTPLGVMLDDLIAGVMALLVVQAVVQVVVLVVV